MTNKEVYEIIKTFDEHKNTKNQDYVADEYIKAGYGQIKGGYF